MHDRIAAEATPEETPTAVRFANPSRRASLAVLARTHVVFLVALAAGIAIRVVVILAYTPGFFYPDSRQYLGNAQPLFTHFVPDIHRPLGYSGYLGVFLHIGDPIRLAIIGQHLLGLCIALAVYTLLVRAGVRGWLATIGVLPVLLDTLQLDLEHYVMADVLCEALAVFAFVLLLWHRRRPPPVWAAAVAGLLLSLGVITRYAAIALIVPALGYLLLRWGGWRAAGRRVAALLAAFLVPIVLYAVDFHGHYGSYSITASGGQFLYGRVGPLADCSRFSVPAAEQILCLGDKNDPRRDTSYLIWSPKSPFYALKPTATRTPDQLAGDFAKRAIKAQPRRFAWSIVQSYAHSLRPTRAAGGSQYWEFHRGMPGTGINQQRLSDDFDGGNVRVRPTLSGFMTHYSTYAYWPGSLDVVAIVLALVAAAGVGRARGSGVRIRCLVLVAVGFLAVVPNDVLSIFGWRYHLQSLPFYPAVAVLAVAALWDGRRLAGRTGRPG